MLERTRRPEKNLSYFSRGLLLPSIADIIILISKFRASGSGYVDFKSIEITINVQGQSLSSKKHYRIQYFFKILELITNL